MTTRTVTRMTAPAEWPTDYWWKSVASQLRDLADNLNCSPVESAQALRRWADSRSDSPAFAAEVTAAREAAAMTLLENRPRSV